MRPSLCRDLALLLLAVAACRSTAEASRPRVIKPVRRPETVVTFEVQGCGVNEALARRNALDNLAVKVGEWLDEQHKEITYVPTQADLEGMAREFSPPEPWTPPKNSKVAELEPGQPMLQVTLKAELTNNDLSTFENRTRQQLSQARQALMARGLAGALAVLAVGTGYLRLEEKVGRHKRKLGLAAMAVVGLVALTLLAFGFDFF